MSFILDALRKSEHERQRSAVPGLSQVPLATPQAKLPRWAVVVIGALGVGVVALGGAWWNSTRTAQEPAESAARTVERSIELPAQVTVAPQRAAPSRRTTPAAPALPQTPSLADAAGTAPIRQEPVPTAATTPAASAPARLDSPGDAVALPSAASLAAEGVAVPTLRLELHAFSRDPRNRFVFINGRKYLEGERLVEGPEVVAIAPTGAVLAHAGRQFLLVQE